MKSKKEEIRSTFKTFWEVWAKRLEGEFTLNSITPFFHKDISTIGTGEHEFGKTYDDVRYNFECDFSEFRKPLTIDYLYEKVRLLSDTVGLVEAEVNVEFYTDDNNLFKLFLRFTTVFVLQKNNWKIIHSHLSMPSTEQDIGEAFPLDALRAKNNRLTNLVNQRTEELNKQTLLLEQEKIKTESLLYNILPVDIAEELKEKGNAEARNFKMASILFSDFKDFTKTSEKLSAKELVDNINVCFKMFDSICEKYNVEKIKTIGDAYMAAGGLPIPEDVSVKNTVLAALEMQAFIVKKHQQEDKGGHAFEMRVGIHTGPVVAGVVGVKKFQYDIWGDTVNMASRIESNGEVGKVNVSEATYNYLKNDPDFVFESRGRVQAKGKGEIEMYFVALA